MKETVFEKAHKHYKKAFKKHQDSLYRTLQSKPVVINDHLYVLVGENRLQQFPLVSYFDVFGENGQSANEEIGRQVHDFFAQILLTEQLKELKNPLEHQLEGSTSEFIVEAETARKQLDLLTEQVDQLYTKEMIEADDMHALKVEWNSFWMLYQQRAQAIMTAYHKQKLSKHSSVLKEATTLNTMYQALVFGDSSTHVPSIHSLIEDNYTFGRLRQEDTPIEKVYKGERKLISVFSYVYGIVIGLVIIIVLALLSDGDLTFSEMVGLLVPIALGYVVKQQSKSRLLAKNNSHVSELRTNQTEQAGTGLREETNKEQPSEQQDVRTKEQPKQPKVLYETYGVMLNNLIIPGIFAVVAFGAAIGLYVEGEMDAITIGIVIFIGFVFVGITALLPLTPLAKQRIVITNHIIHIHKERLNRLEVVRIVLKGNGKSIHIFVDYHDSPHKIRMVSGDEEHVISALQTWCANNQIPFKDDIKKAI